MSGLVLMENAGRGAAERIAELVPTGGVTILCGRGNNAGDGYVIARHLQLLDRDVRIVSLVELEELSGDAAANANLVVRGEIPVRVATDSAALAEAIDGDETVVDCLLGTGAQGDPREPYRTAVELANGGSGPRVAIDVPTGLDCDTGVPGSPTFRADHTITFVSSKVGFDAATAGDRVGQVHVIGIGVPLRLLRQVRDAV